MICPSLPDTPSGFPLAIIGAGALGLHFAARLAGFGPVAVLARSAARAETLRAGLVVGDARFRPQAFGPDDPIRAEWVLLLVKTGDTEAAARQALHLQPHGILSLQNGLTESRLRAVCGSVPAAQGLTTEGAYRDSAGVHPAGAGETLLPPGFETLAAHLQAAGFRARVALLHEGGTIQAVLPFQHCTVWHQRLGLAERIGVEIRVEPVSSGRSRVRVVA